MATEFHITNLSTAGLNIYTTLDLNLQNEAQAVIQHYINGTNSQNLELNNILVNQPARTARRGTALPPVARIVVHHSTLLATTVPPYVEATRTTGRWWR